MARLTGTSYAKITIAILLALMLFVVAGWGTQCSSWQVRYGSDTVAGNASIATGDVRNIEIDWAAGSVQVQVVDSDTDYIELIETGEGITRGREMRWKVTGDTLHVDYGGWFSCFWWGHKNLEVRVPQQYADDLGRLSIGGASGYYRVSGVGCDRLDVALASGEFEGTDFTANELNIDVASGKAHAGGVVANKINAHAASGQIEVICQEVCPRVVDVDMASGTIAVSIPENDGFTATVDKASGIFEHEFEMTQTGDGVYVYKDGTASFDIDMASGTFILNRTT